MKTAFGTCDSTGGTETWINIGFRPKYVAILCTTSTYKYILGLYAETFSTTEHIYIYPSGGGVSASNKKVQNGSGSALRDINDTGFSIYMSKDQSWIYFAIG